MNDKRVKMNKAKDILSKTFVESADGLNEDELNAMIAKSMQRKRDLKSEMEADEKLTAARQIVKDLSEGYKSVMKVEEARVDFLLGKLDEIQGEGMDD